MDRFNEAFVQISPDTVSLTVDGTKQRLLAVLDFADEYRVLHTKVIEFMLCLTGSFRVPSARQLIKVHKTIISSRLIVASTSWITTPLQVWLATFLQPLINVSLHTVAKDTANIVDVLNSIDWQNTPGVVNTFDVEKLYPSMDFSKVRQVVVRFLLRHFQRFPRRHYGVIIEVINEIMGIIFDAQVCKYHILSNDQDHILFFLQTVGITTGLNCGVQLASIYLSEMDAAFSDALSADLYAYKRFVDDILVVSTADITRMLALFETHGDGLQVTHDEEEDSRLTHFLDLLIDIRESSLKLSTYRKPLNMYDYVPGNSAHPVHTKQALIRTEMVRLLRTNSDADSFNFHRDFFLGKLKARGHDVLQARAIADEYPFSSRCCILDKSKKQKTQKKLVPFKLTFATGADDLGISSAVRKHSWRLGEKQHQLRFVTCYLAGKSLFRLRYSRFI